MSSITVSLFFLSYVCMCVSVCGGGVLFVSLFVSACVSVCIVIIFVCVSVCLSEETYQFSARESLPVASVVAKIKALDADVGPNAEMDYRIIDGDGLGMFRISTDKDTQEGVITLLKVFRACPDHGVGILFIIYFAHVYRLFVQTRALLCLFIFTR